MTWPANNNSISDWKHLVTYIIHSDVESRLIENYGSVEAFIEIQIAKFPAQDEPRSRFYQGLSLAVQDWEPLERISTARDSSLRVGLGLLLNYRPLTGWRCVLQVINKSAVVCGAGRINEVIQAIATAYRYFPHKPIDPIELDGYSELVHILYDLALSRESKPGRGVVSWAIATLVLIGALDRAGNFSDGREGTRLGDLNDIPQLDKARVLSAIKKLGAGADATRKQRLFSMAMMPANIEKMEDEKFIDFLVKMSNPS